VDVNTGTKSSLPRGSYILAGSNRHLDYTRRHQDQLAYDLLMETASASVIAVSNIARAPFGALRRPSGSLPKPRLGTELVRGKGCIDGYVRAVYAFDLIDGDMLGHHARGHAAGPSARAHPMRSTDPQPAVTAGCMSAYLGFAHSGGSVPRRSAAMRAK
jgi:hypothetical protein